MKNKIIFPILLFCIPCGFLSAVFLFISCNKPETENCSYTSQIKQIVASKCTIEGCHNGTTLADFRSYETLKSRADNGRLRQNVFELKIMPPANVPQLTDQEKEKLKCWLDNGAQQN